MKCKIKIIGQDASTRLVTEIRVIRCVDQDASTRQGDASGDQLVSIGSCEMRIEIWIQHIDASGGRDPRNQMC